MKLIFIYNAKRGIIHEIADTFHKLFNPTTYPCSLCGLTYGLLGKLKPRAAFLNQLACDKEFLYRAEADPYIKSFGLPPQVLLQKKDNLSIVSSAEDLRQMNNIQELIQAITHQLNEKDHPSDHP